MLASRLQKTQVSINLQFSQKNRTKRKSQGLTDPAKKISHSKKQAVLEFLLITSTTPAHASCLNYVAKTSTHPFPNPTILPQVRIMGQCWVRGGLDGQLHDILH